MSPFGEGSGSHGAQLRLQVCQRHTANFFGYMRIHCFDTPWMFDQFDMGCSRHRQRSKQKLNNDAWGLVGEFSVDHLSLASSWYKVREQSGQCHTNLSDKEWLGGLLCENGNWSRRWTLCGAACILEPPPVPLVKLFSLGTATTWNTMPTDWLQRPVYVSLAFSLFICVYNRTHRGRGSEIWKTSKPFIRILCLLTIKNQTAVSLHVTDKGLD